MWNYTFVIEINGRPKPLTASVKPKKEPDEDNKSNNYRGQITGKENFYSNNKYSKLNEFLINDDKDRLL